MRLSTSLNHFHIFCILNVCTPACAQYLHNFVYLLCAFLMSSCSCSLSFVLHPFPLFCALAEVSPVLFNPASLIPITLHLLHWGYCPTALASLLHRLNTSPLTSPATLVTQPYWHTYNIAPNVQNAYWVPAQIEPYKTSQFNHHPLSSRLSSQERNPLWITIGLWVMCSQSPMQLQCSTLHYI